MRYLENMLYRSKKELPASIRDNLPSHAQSIWKEAFNSSYDKHKDEVIAIKIAWGAVKKKYKKNEEEEWVEKNN